MAEMPATTPERATPFLRFGSAGAVFALFVMTVSYRYF
jgi:hypothetical protein